MERRGDPVQGRHQRAGAGIRGRRGARSQRTDRVCSLRRGRGQFGVCAQRRAVDHDHYRYKLDWLARLRDHLEATCEPWAPVLVGGDFNVCPDDRDVWDPDNEAPRTHVSEPEREAVRSVCDWGLRDIFRDHYDAAGLFSWWDYRDGSFYKRHGLRIDLLLGTAPVAAAARFCLIDRNARKGIKPSDHTPVFADLAL